MPTTLSDAVIVNIEFSDPDHPRTPAPVRRALAVWPEHVRVLPNAVLRSALFGVIKAGEREAVKGLELPATHGVKLTFTGWRLDQADADVWQTLVHLGREQLKAAHQQGADVVVRIQLKTLLRHLGRTPGSGTVEWLDGVLTRLQSGVIRVDSKAARVVYQGQLILHWMRAEDTGEMHLRLNGNLLALFSDGWSSLIWSERRSLGKQQLAQWLHAFYATHLEPYPMRVETLRALSGGRPDSPLREFRRQLKNALTAVAKTGAITAWRIDPATDLVHVTCRPRTLTSA